KVDDPQAYARLLSIPGVGKRLPLVLLYEIHAIGRFASAGRFLSYCRLVRCAHESAGKKKGSGPVKIGNAHLRWAFAEAACLFVRQSPRAKAWLQRQEKKHGKGRGLAILAARLGRAVYHLLRKGEVFDEERFWGPRARAGARRRPYGFLFSVPGRAACRGSISASSACWCPCGTCWTYSAGRGARAAGSSCGARARCTGRGRRRAAASRCTWASGCIT